MSDLGAVAKDMASAMARGAEKGGKAIIEHYKSIGEGLLKSSALHKDVEDAAEKAAKNIGKGAVKDVEHGAEQAGNNAEKGIVARVKNGLKRVFSKKGADDNLACRPGTNDPIDVATGDVLFSETDVMLPGVLPLVLERTHRSSMDTGRWFGSSWMSSLDQRLLVTPDRVIGAFADGRVLTWTTPDGSEAAVVPVSGPLWPLRRHPDGSCTVQDPQRGLTWKFERRDGYEAAEEEDTELPVVSVADRIGHEITFSYDTAGRPLNVSHSGGYRVQVYVTNDHVTGLVLAGRDGEEDMPLRKFEYDGDGNLSGVINSSGLAMRFTYDDAGRMTSWTDRNGHFYRYTYDDQGRCVSGEGPGGALSDRLAYEPGMTRVTDAAGAVTIHEITDSGRLAATTDPLGNTTRWEYDDRGNITTEIDPLGRVTQYAYDDRGNLTAVTRPDGSQATTEYDERCLPVLLTDPDGATWRQEYDDRGNRIAATVPDRTIIRFGYDENGHLSSVISPDGANSTITCDAAGLPVEVTGPNGGQTRYETDPAGRVTRKTDPDGTVTSLTWTPEGKLSSQEFPDGTAETLEWDGEGNLTVQVSAAGAVSRYEYGPFDKVTAMTGPDGTRSEFDYDHAMRVTAARHGGLEWRYVYNAAGRLTAETDYNGATTDYAYDAAGQVTRQANAAGQEITFAHDEVGNLVSQAAGEAVTEFGYDPAGGLSWARGPGTELRFDRDVMGQVVAETCNGRKVTKTYDTKGRLTRRVTPSGRITSWETGTLGEPTAVTTAGGQRLRFGYDLVGRETSRELPGGLSLTQEWDQRGRLAAQVLSASGGSGRPMQRRVYDYSPDGYVTGTEDLLAGNRAFVLDTTGRVTSVAGPGWAESYSYDSAGSVSAATWPDVPTPWLDAGSQGQREVTGTLVTRAGNIRYRYDAAGRVISRRKAGFPGSRTSGATTGMPRTGSSPSPFPTVRHGGIPMIPWAAASPSNTSARTESFSLKPCSPGTTRFSSSSPRQSPVPTVMT